MLFGGSAAAGLAAKGPGACQGLLRGICSLLGGLSCFLIFWFWMGLIWFFHTSAERCDNGLDHTRGV